MDAQNKGYGAVARALHWLMAALLILQWLSGEESKAFGGMGFHFSLGLTLMLLVLVRLGWRVMHVPPALPAGMPKLMQFAAHAGHFLLYALMLAIPLTGWLMSSAKGFQTVWFGLLPIPDLLDKNKELGDLLAQVHSALNFLFIAVIVGHVGAALKHHLIDKDDILTRMLPKH